MNTPPNGNTFSALMLRTADVDGYGKAHFEHALPSEFATPGAFHIENAILG